MSSPYETISVILVLLGHVGCIVQAFRIRFPLGVLLIISETAGYPWLIINYWTRIRFFLIPFPLAILLESVHWFISRH